MRLHEMYHLIKYTVDNWVTPNIVDEQAAVPSASIYSCRNSLKLKKHLDPLRIIPYISAIIDDIYACSPEFTVKSTVYLSKEGRSKLINSANKIRNDLTSMIAMCEALGIEENSDGFDVKLPHNMTLGEFSSCAKDLDHIFTQCPLLNTDDEQIQLRGVDIGSVWFTFSIVGAGAATTFYILNNLASMVSKIMAIREQMAICRQQEELARQAGLKNEVLQTIVEANKSVYKNLIRNVTEELAAKNNITSNDDIEHIRGSLIMLKEWMDKGMEVYAAIEAPADIKAVFPPPEVQALPDFMLNMLEGHGGKAE